MFLLFLLGLNLHPQKLIASIKQSTLITFGASLVFAGIGFIAAWLLQLSLMDQLVIAAAFMFSSTIIGLKLLPTTVLHHQHVGEIIISNFITTRYFSYRPLAFNRNPRSGHQYLIFVRKTSDCIAKLNCFCVLS